MDRASAGTGPTVNETSSRVAGGDARPTMPQPGQGPATRQAVIRPLLVRGVVTFELLLDTHWTT